MLRPNTRDARLAPEDLLPLNVVVVDIEDLPEEISAARPDGGLYRGVWLLVRVAGRPRDLVSIALSGQSLARADLERHLHGLDRRRPATVEQELTRPPRVSVAVCSTLSREQELLAALRSIGALEYPDFEVLLVDNRRGGGPLAQLPDDLGRVRLLREPRPGLSRARNCALRAATGTIIAFTDDDVVVDSRWLTALAQRFAREACACVTGLVLPWDLSTPSQAAFETYYGGFGPRTLNAATYGLERAPRTGFFGTAMVLERDDEGRVVSRFPLYNVGRFGVGANMAFRTDVLRAAGGFNTALGAGTPALGGEDIGMFARLVWQGQSISFDPAALVHHRHRATDEDLKRQIQAYGLGLTATLTALVGEDPRHLGAMISTAPAAVRVLSRSIWKKLRLHPDRDPRDRGASSFATLARLEMRAMARGPAAYVRSARRARRS